MSTRAQVRFATREQGVSFSEHPKKINAQFYVHHDGYPEGLGLDIAYSLNNFGAIQNWEIESLDCKRTDLEYIYYIWQAEGKDTAISIFERSGDYCVNCGHVSFSKCIFVGTPQELINKYCIKK